MSQLRISIVKIIIQFWRFLFYYKSISNIAQYAKFSYLLFSNATHKTGTANRWEITNSKPLGPVIIISQSETLR
jgi:hypothetical protein